MAGFYPAFSASLFPGYLSIMIYLASQSPRRAELLQQIGVPFQKLSCEIDETPWDEESPEGYVQRMAEQKALAGWQELVKQNMPAKPLLASDTTVVCDGRIMGKPENDQMAYEMLAQLSGRKHQVMTAIAITDGGEMKVQLVTTDVTFLALTPEQISKYVATGEPRDKAGSYGIQGKGAVLVASIHGSYSSVVGLPLSETAKLLAHFNISVWQ